MRLPRNVRDDLIKRMAALPNFRHLVLDAHPYSLRPTENEWRNDFEIAPYLEIGSLKQYALT